MQDANKHNFLDYASTYLLKQRETSRCQLLRHTFPKTDGGIGAVPGTRSVRNVSSSETRPRAQRALGEAGLVGSDAAATKFEKSEPLFRRVAPRFDRFLDSPHCCRAIATAARAAGAPTTGLILCLGELSKGR